MKPKAPAEVRGPFGSIATNAPGLRVCEHLPHTARVMDRLAILRAMHHPMTNHNAAAFATLCGRNPLKGDLELLSNDRNDPPCLGATFSAAAAAPAGPAHGGGAAARDVQRGAAPRPGRGLPRLGTRAVPGQRRPRRARLPPRRSRPPRRRHDRPARSPGGAAPTARRPAPPRRGARRRERAPARPERRLHREGLRAVAFGGGAKGIRPGRGGPAAPRPIRPHQAGPVDAPGPPAGRGRRPVRHGLRRPAQRPARQLGLARGQLPPPQGRPAAAGRPGVRGADRRPDRARPARRDAGHRRWASSAGRPGSTRPPVATTGRIATASSWPAAASGAGLRTARATSWAPTRTPTRSPRPTSPPPSSGGWASTRPARSSTSPAAPTSLADGRPIRAVFG